MDRGQTVETERLILRPPSPDDFGALHRIFSDAVTMSFWPVPFTEEDTRRWISRSLHDHEETGFGRCPVLLKSSGEVIGDCGIMRAEIAGEPEYDLGYIIHHPFWGNDYAVEAAEACKRHAVERLGIRRLVANMPTAHAASIRVAEKISMRWEKTFRNPRNRYIETHLYALVAA
ncbi:MAG: GNAT family N-acetyltransferase [Rubrobacter sp.]|nr:GNAT family N-acetyltransferase [Rubrobacter sp.]